MFVNVYRTVRRGGGGVLTDEESWSRYLFGVARNVVRDHWQVTKAGEAGRADRFVEDENWAERVADPHQDADVLE